MHLPRHAASAFFRREAAEQGGLLGGQDPTAIDLADPLRLWIIQLGVILSLTSLLAVLLHRLRQPKVIAEVLGGILLGPTAFGRIPGFTAHVFPSQSTPFLSLTANIGLCLFLFLVGMEIDMQVIKRNARLSASVALAGMCLPFAVGAGLSVALYRRFVDPDVAFTHFMLFACVAFSITAFPVLCRILTELKLLDTTVGIVVLSAGVGNDIVGWTLLALSVALVNAGSGLSALYILLCCIAWALFLLVIVKRLLRRLALRTGSIENGPTMFFMTITFILVFGSSFFTDVIGVHAIFGAFLAGLIIPRDNGLTIALTEKLEDMVSIIFLPLYFALSGLSTNLGLLNNAITWAYTLSICACAFFGKFGGCTLAAHYLARFGWRESAAVGSMMSCKGLVELIVLNVGLSAGILSQRVFSMFVLEALLLTFMTTPLVEMFYPAHLRRKVGAGEGAVPPSRGKRTDGDGEQGKRTRTRFTVVLDKIEHLPAMMAVSQLIQPTSPSISISIDALRLIELSDRTSAVMKSSVSESLLHTDPLLCIFRMFGRLGYTAQGQGQGDGGMTSTLQIVTSENLVESVVGHAGWSEADMILLPWIVQHPHRDPVTSDSPAPSNPFEALWKSSHLHGHAQGGGGGEILHSHFIRGVFSKASVDVGLYIDSSSSSPSHRTRTHLFVPFFGGPDDRLALEMALQLVRGGGGCVAACVVRYIKCDPEDDDEALVREDTGTGTGKGVRIGGENMMSVHSTVAGFPDTIYGHHNTETRMQSDTADNILWTRVSGEEGSDGLGMITFKEIHTPTPLTSLIHQANQLLESNNTGQRIIIITGRSRRFAVENHREELKGILDAVPVEQHADVSAETRKTIGDVATACLVVRAGVVDGILVVQAARGDV